jgi:pSer/pThr/pTyr-binding forkhead associated (FHA) protein
MRSRVLLQWLAGTLGGVLAWMLTEPWPYLNPDVAPGQPPLALDWTRMILFGVITGAAISACIAAAYGAGSPARVRRSALIGAAAGIVGGGLGLIIGQWVFQTIGAAADAMGTRGALSPVGTLLMIVARSLGWCAVGAGFGVLQGLINGSRQRSINGAIGGAVGGFIGGAVFQLLALTVQVTTNAAGQSPLAFINGAILRFLGLTITGSFIGLFVGLAERVTRNAWVRVRVGRNEGAEFLLEKPSSVIGRDELSDIPLFGDMTVQRRHAVIAGGRGAYTVEALAPGVLVNGQAVQKAPLSDGALIRIGGREIEFHQKGTPRAVPQKDVAKPAVATVPVPEGVCPFCGERRDALGRCACSPVGTAAPAPSPVAAGLTPSPAAATSTPGGPRLVGLNGPYAGQVFALAKPETTVGREPDRDIPLASDTSVSRRHALFRRGAAGVEISDEGSSNGTFVNGARVTSRSLHPGDEVKIGASVFRVEGVGP